jgi:hypothetical protein
VTNPGSNTSTSTFTPTIAGTYMITALEAGVAGTTYTVQATQSL